MIRRTLTIALAFALVGLVFLRPQTPVQAAPPDDEARFVALINELRLSEDLQPLVVDPELVNTARSWAVELAEVGELSHSTDLSVGVSADWAKLGENVGVSPEGEVIRLFQAFVDSPTHLDNLLDSDFDSVGVGVVYSDGKIWTTHRFMDRVSDETELQAAAGNPVIPERGSAEPNTAAIAGLLRDLAS